MNMRLHVHMLNKSIQDSTIQVYKPVSMLFSFSPDILCLLPKHRIGLVGKKFEKWERRYTKTTSKLLKSISYGIMIHFACDFATAPHNFVDSMDKKEIHQKYERQLTKYRAELRELEDEAEVLTDMFMKLSQDGHVLDGIRLINEAYFAANYNNAHEKNPINEKTRRTDYLYARVMTLYVCRALCKLESHSYQLCEAN